MTSRDFVLLDRLLGLLDHEGEGITILRNYENSSPNDTGCIFSYRPQAAKTRNHNGALTVQCGRKVFLPACRPLHALLCHSPFHVSCTLNT